MVVSLLLVGTIIVSGVYGYKKKKEYEGTIKDQKQQIQELGSQIEGIGEFQTVYKLTKDVKGGLAIKKDDLEAIDVPIALADNAVSDLKQIKDQIYVLGLKKGTTLTTEMMKDYKLTDDLRLQDIVLDEMPIGIEEGDFVDVRIAFPNGEDYVVLDKNRVESINGSTAKLVVRGSDFHAIESVYTDQSWYMGTKVYMTEYIEPGFQDTSKRYYPMGFDSMKALLLDPTYNMWGYQKRLENRKNLELRLEEDERVEKTTSYTAGKQNIMQKYAEAAQAYEEYLSRKAEIEAQGGDPEAAEAGTKSEVQIIE